MISLVRPSGILRTTLALALLALPLLALGKSQVPFKGSFAGTPSAIPGISAIEGHATHLGHFTGTSMVTEVTPTGFIGAFTWEAANGDSVFGIVVVTLGAPLGSGVFAFDSVGTILGGTGRFEGASGNSGGPGVIDLNTFEFTATFKGTITSPGSLK